LRVAWFLLQIWAIFENLISFDITGEGIFGFSLHHNAACGGEKNNYCFKICLKSIRYIYQISYEIKTLM
jgi:hypothetical protein